MTSEIWVNANEPLQHNLTDMKEKNTTTILKFITLACLLSILSSAIKSQTVIFENGDPSSGSEIGNSVMEAPDGSLIVVGSTTTDTEGLADIKVSKLNADGSEIWTVTHGGFNNDFPGSAVMLADGSFVIVGTTGSFTDSPSRDVYLLKMDSEGEILWTHSYGGEETDEGTDIKLTSEGDFIITAFTESYGEGETDGWLFKTDSEGNLLWDQTFGGSESDNLAGVDIAADGGYILAGSTESFAEGMHEDLWLIKTDADGNEMWSQSLGVADRIDEGRGVEATSDGYVAIGLRDNDPDNPPPLTGDAFFIKTDLDGNLLWNQSVAGVFRVEGFGVYPSQDGGWLICGNKVESPTSAVFWVAKADEFGEISWEIELGQAETVSLAFDLIQANNGDVVATGFSGLTPSSSHDLHVLRLTDQTLFVSKASQTIEFTVMPNPTQGKLKPVLPQKISEGTLFLLNEEARIVKSLKFTDPAAIDLDLSGLPAGSYLLRVVTTAGAGAKRIIKY